MRRIGIFGGTFNPIHNGHLAVAQTACEKLKLHRVIFVPAKMPVHKGSLNVVEPGKRLKMVGLAIKGYGLFEASNIEITSKNQSYSIETVRHFREKFAGDKLYFIIGSDSSRTLHTWKSFDDLVNIVKFVCVNRPGNTRAAADKYCRYIEMPELDISSSMIRRRISKGLPVGFYLPQAVDEYIRRNKIYTSTQK
ncbi:MAG: nicotinate-nucleotide adenylyltransferase [Candidatus Omnitrophica bacterium]|nr:nicotinate-nucleotide adenylyltransferase [Candidatus Omnitrophota bacterium]